MRSAEASNYPKCCGSQDDREGVILDDQGGQQINVRDDDKSPTLRAETHGHPPCVIGVDVYNQHVTGEQAHPLRAARSDADHTPCVCYGFPLGFRPENVRLYDETATTLCNGTRAGFCNGVVYDTRGNGDGSVVPTITGDHENRVTDYTAVVCLEGNGSRPSHRGDGYDVNCPMYTLNTIERHAVAYGIDQQGGKGGANYTCGVAPTLCSDSHGTPHAVAFQTYQKCTGPLMANSHPGSYTGQDAFNDMLVAGAYTLKIGGDVENQ